jgi:type IV secretory pathway TraG/TraD family ATPase VirD4
VQHAAVLLILEGLKEADYEASLGLLYDILVDPGKLQDMLRKTANVPEALTTEVNRLASLSKETREERFSGLLSQLRPFASGDLKRLTTRIEFDLVELIQKGDPNACPTGAVILLNAMQFQKSAKVLGKLILQTAAWASSTRGPKAPFVALYVDEFSSFVYDGFEQFLNKARSRNVGLHISHQSIGDLESVSPSFAKTVNVNTNVKVLLGLNDPDTADYFAKHLGTRTTQKTTERARIGNFGETEMVGEMSLRDVEQYKVHPNKLKNYSRGQGVLSLLVHGIPVVEEVQFERGA